MNVRILKPLVRLVARAAGKKDPRVIAVFGLSPRTSDQAVRHVRAGAGEIPVWLFCTSQPDPETAELCERVLVRRSSILTVLEAQRLLWPHRVALSVGTWTGQRGGCFFKLTPFVLPPFRALFLNSSGDFVNGRSTAALVHAWRLVREWIFTLWYRMQDGYAWCLWAVCTAAQWCLWAVRAAAHWTSDAVRLASRRASGKIRSAGHTIGDALRAIGVSLAGRVFRLTGNPHRTWFRRMHGGLQPGTDSSSGTTDPSACALPSGPCGYGAAQMRACGRDWHGAAIEAEVASSDARWLIWSESSIAKPIAHPLPLGADLLSLFEDDRTFAVSIQRHYRGWSPSMVFTAPFRQLQAGEAAAVLAPLSDTIVVDRRKLAAMPIPRCGLSATAWLDIFWRAAAAGWRSYSVGASKPATTQPDYPATEAEFFFRSLVNPGLRHLTPQNPDLLRGNTAFSPVAARAACAELSASVAPRHHVRRRVLVVSPFLPFPLSHGGAVRIWNLCRALRDRVDFFLIAVRERDEHVDYEVLGEVFREIHAVDLDELPSGSADLPHQVRHHRSRSLEALIHDLSTRLRPDLIQIEYTHLAHFADGRTGPEASRDIPCLLVEHDITFSLYSQLTETETSREARLEYERWRTFEGRYLRKFDAVWTMSDDDRRMAIREGSQPDSTFVVPNGVDTLRFVPRPEVAEEPEILYVGSFRHLPNLIGFEILCRDVMPQVWSRHPAARLRVVAGPQHEMFWQRFRGNPLTPVDPRIDVQGFVSDLRPLYASASVVSVPLAVSAGTNIKVLEAMACGKAVVSTPVGCAGLGLHDGQELLIREASGFAAGLCQLLESERMRADLGAAARRTAEQRFSWKAIADRAWQSYLSVWAPVVWDEIETKAS